MQERIYAYAKAANYLINFYATNNVIAKAAAEVETFKQLLEETAVSFAEVLKEKALRC